jgi:hypothetical protein
MGSRILNVRIRTPSSPLGGGPQGRRLVQRAKRPDKRVINSGTPGPLGPSWPKWTAIFALTQRLPFLPLATIPLAPCTHLGHLPTPPQQV